MRTDAFGSRAVTQPQPSAGQRRAHEAAGGCDDPSLRRRSAAASLAGQESATEHPHEAGYDEADFGEHDEQVGEEDLQAVGGRRLRHVLVLTDLAMCLIAWTAAAGIVVGPLGYRDVTSRVLGAALLASTASVGFIMMNKLHLARTCAVRSVELRGTGRASVATGVTLLAGYALANRPLPVSMCVIGSLTMFWTLVVGRAWYRAWLRGRRARGLYVRRVALVGYNEDAQRLQSLFTDQPELGYRVVGVVDSAAAAAASGLPWLGDIDGAADAIRRSRTNGAVLVASAIAPQRLNELIRTLHEANVHVHLSSGLHGIAHQRVRPVPFAHEPTFYLEPSLLSDWQLAVKRAVDVTMAVVLLVTTAPILALTALLIKLESKGPVLFRQRRVGLDGTTFEVVKFRSMRTNAEEQLPALRGNNERSTSPLFKLSDDPRTTRVGRVIRATSIDELPQLVNVLRGEMSLVGPRPALPEETEQFDEQLQGRTKMPPGLTGLWQIEARDNPSFGPYRRLDLFYVDNWSVTLDLSIILATGVAIIGRGIRILRTDRSARGQQVARPITTGNLFGDAPEAQIEHAQSE